MVGARLMVVGGLLSPGSHSFLSCYSMDTGTHHAGLSSRSAIYWQVICSLSSGNPLQYSCLENPMDGGAWWAAIYGVTQSWTRLTRLSNSSSL